MISMQEIVGKGYADFWNFKGRYVAVKGSRASKKSKTCALWIISHLIQYPLANALYVRKTYNTMKDSCYSDCLWAINRLGLDAWFVAKTQPLEIEYIPTGQRILFRGCDDPLKLTSLSVPTGVLCWAVFEEAYEISREETFDVIDESIRGEMPEGYFKRVFVLLNPWSEKHWIKKRFFDVPDNDNKLSMTTNYKCNEWLTEDDYRLFEDMKQRNPRRYQVAGLGNWGIAEGLVYDNWKEEAFEIDDLEGVKTAFGLDFGYSVDPTAFIVAYIDTVNFKLYIYDEFYEPKLSNRMIYDKITAMGYAKETIIADSAEPKSIDELKGLGLRRIEGAKKGKDSINQGIQFLQNFEIIVHPRCVNFITEISNYAWSKDKFGNMLNSPIDEFNHLMDAMRYGCERYSRKNGWMI